MSDIISFVTAEAIKPLLKKLKQIRHDRHADLITVADTFGDPVQLASYYVEPYCQHQNPADYNEEDPISAIRSPVFATINDFFNREFSSPAEGKNVLFVLSDAGMGKTSLLMMIHLAYLTKFWPAQYRSVLLKLGPQTLEQVASLTERSRTVLLLDSLDEDPVAWEDPERRIISLLAATTNFRRVIVTCRTQYFPKSAADPFNRPGRVEIGGYVCPMLFLSYFDERQVDTYLSKRFRPSFLQRLNGQLAPEHVQAKLVLNKVRSLQFRPLLLAHIEDLLGTESVAWDDFGTYAALLDTWLLREERKLREQGHEVRKEDLLTACAIVALEMQKTGARTISLAKMEELIERSRDISYLKRFNFGGRSLLNRNSNGEFRFSHYSIQEFLVAYRMLGEQRRGAEFGITMTDQIFAFLSSRIEEFRRLLDVPSPSAGLRHVFDERQICRSCGLSREYALHAGIPVCSDRVQVSPTFVFSGARFDDMDLSERDLSGLCFTSCSFVRTNLSGSDLSRCNFTCASFEQADLSRANLTDAALIKVDLNTAVIESTTFNGARLDGVDISGRDLSGLSFRACAFIGAMLRGTDFSDCDLRSACFDEADLSAAIFSDALTDGATFEGAVTDGMVSNPKVKQSRK